MVYQTAPFSMIMNDPKLVMDDFEISKHDRFRFDFLKKI